MNEIINLEELLKTHRMATNLEEVWVELEKKTFDHVYVRSLFHDTFYPISKIITRPFVFAGTKDGYEIRAIDLLNNNEVAKLRIVGTAEQAGTIEIKNIHRKEWFRPEMDSLRIYIPF